MVYTFPSYIVNNYIVVLLVRVSFVRSSRGLGPVFAHFLASA